MQKKSKERIIKEIIIESNKLLELVQWNDQKEDKERMKIYLKIVQDKCKELENELG